MRVGAYPKYGAAAASTRHRLLQFVQPLAQAGISIEAFPLLTDDYVRALESGHTYPRMQLARSYVRRLGLLAHARRYDSLWIYAELFPNLPAPFESLAFSPGRPVVYDFDDAFFLKYEGRAMLGGKLDRLIAGAAVCCCGNGHLLDHALRLNPNSVLLPTVVDTSRYRPADRGDRPLTIGWIGSPTNWQYVQPLLGVLEDLCEEYKARFLVVGAGTPAEADRFPRMEARAWREDREVHDIQEMDVGIMPLPDEAWAKGKSGFKLVQYMSCGLPAVASPVGANRDILQHGATGYLARTASEWSEALVRLLRSPALRLEMGARGRDRIVAGYSLEVHAPRLAALLLAL